ncbi:hypothetical protein SAMN04487943_101456 [Gracilibacillus orientalis]|uniref:Uncharacterized protein n=1 Tax=Gracilibacillus orientalis TaxID=334253 RepID=A0A1I4HJP4_9BACI|nr:hypothetical protein [Gracilibacillus orientalis]SFL41927.1 hypothetical protein SAMN04487943_101456 [Gracilibacillus orientalis]
MGTARAEDPLGKVIFFTKLAEAVPAESEVFCRSVSMYISLIRMEGNFNTDIFTVAQFVSTRVSFFMHHW